MPGRPRAYIALMRLKPVLALLALVLFAQDVLLGAVPVCATSHPHGGAAAPVHQAHAGAQTPEPSGGHRLCLTAPSDYRGTHSPASCAVMNGCSTAPALARALVAPIRPPDTSEPPVVLIAAPHTFHLPPVPPPPKA